MIRSTMLSKVLIAGGSLLILSGCGGGSSPDLNTTEETPVVLNHPPVAQADNATTDEDSAVSIDVLSNDSDVDGDTLAITNLTQPAHGTTSIENNKVTYTPEANYNGTDSFSYTPYDGTVDGDAVTVLVTINVLNDTSICPDGGAAPSLVLKGSAEQYFVVNDPYFFDHQLSAEAWDNEEGNLTSRIQVDDNVVRDKVGDYAIHYQVEDCAGQKAEANRTIHMVKNYSVFLHSTRLSRTEPWISDGTPEGTHMIEETNSTIRQGYFSLPVKVGDKAYFTSDANGYYDSLWVTDGTAGGTHLVTKTNPHGSDSVNIKGWTDTLLFFEAADGKGLNGRYANTLWVTDGTENSTHLYDGEFVPNGKSFELANGKRCYLVDYWSPKIALWCGDGSIDGTEKVLESDEDTSLTVYRFDQNHILQEGKDLVLWNGTLYETNGTAQSTEAYTDLPDTIKQIAQWNDETFFFTAYIDNKAKLYRSTDPSSDPLEIKDEDNNSVSVELYTGLGDRLYFRAYYPYPWSCSYSGLWKLDNPKTDTQLHKISDERICKVGPEINGNVFTLTSSNDLWVYRVNDNNFTQLDDLHDGLISYSYDTSNICQGKFIVRTYDHGLWATDGTQEGTEQFYSGSVQSFKVLKDQIFFRHYEQSERKYFYYKSQGTAASTERIGQDEYYISASKPIVVGDKELIFPGYNFPLYVHDKTTDETYELMKGINKATEGVVYFSSDKDTVDQFGAIAYFGKNMMFDGQKIVHFKGIREMRKITYLDGKLYFLDMGDRTVTTQLYRMNVDGTEMENLSGVWQWGDDRPKELVRFKGYIYFPKQGKATLSRINNDMTQPENIQDKDDRNITYVRSFMTGEDHLYFQAKEQDGDDGDEVFCTDGTQQGTFEIKDIKPGRESSLSAYGRNRLHGTVSGDKLYFRANDGNGTKVWVSDGTEDGTFSLIDENLSLNLIFGKTAGRVYFRDTEHRSNWGTDGTKAGTFKFVDNNTNEKRYSRTFIDGMGSQFYFTYADVEHGSEVWTIKDDSQSPVLLKDIAEGNTSGTDYRTTTYDTSKFVFGDKLYFTAFDPDNGRRLWTTQGDEASTNALFDHAPEGPYTTLGYTKRAQLDTHHLIIGAYSPAAVYLLDDNGTMTKLAEDSE